MLIDTRITIAYKCTSCGSFEFFNVSLFKLPGKKNGLYACRCKKSGIELKQEGENYYLVSIPCIGCGGEHTYLLTRRNILSGDLVVFSCPETGVVICSAGRDEAVRKKIDNLEEELDELMNMYGYESYFTNTQVMFDMVNRIHDIALSGKLYCECGSTDIEMIMLSECIFLRCRKCGGNKLIPASKNKDLKDILAKEQIILGEDTFQRDIKDGEILLSTYLGDKIGK